MPIAYEGALKLKEISYIHAEAYPAGEMKHGPIALIDRSMPVLAIAPRDPWYEKMISQIEQAKSRGGRVLVVATDGDPGGWHGDHVLLGARDALAAEPGNHGDPTAVVCLSYRGAAGVGCGPAAQPGEERDGGVGR
jgi:fructoselysine-6-P-deglycase FrlB-like protein